MSRNIELLTKVRDLVREHPEKLDMGTWVDVAEDLVDFKGESEVKVSCGTTACIAGWTVLLAGDKLLVRDIFRNEDGSYETATSVAKNGRVCLMENRARKLLGLRWDESDFLFFCKEHEAVQLLTDLIDGKELFIPPVEIDFEALEEPF